VKKASSSGAIDHLRGAPTGERVPEEDTITTDSKRLPRREEVVDFGPDTIEQVIRERIRATIETIVEEELKAALEAVRPARVGEGRRGYRHGMWARTLTTSLGPTTFTVSRARLLQAEGGTLEWQSRTLPRYQRRTARVDEAPRRVLERDEQLPAQEGSGPVVARRAGEHRLFGRANRAQPNPSVSLM